MKGDRLEEYARFSDREVYEALCDLHPELLTALDQLAQMQAFRGFTDEELLAAFRKTWPKETRDVWEEGNEFRGRLMLRGIHHLASLMRSRQSAAGMN